MIIRRLLLIISLIWVNIAVSQPGTVDLTFRTDFNCNALVKDNSSMKTAAVQADGKIIAGGFCNINFIFGSAQSNLFRLNIDGSLDTSFKVGTGVDGDVSFIGIMPDKRILVSGNMQHINKLTCKSTILLFPNGKLDSVFHQNLYKLVDRVFTPVILPNNKIIIWGFKASKGILIRVNSNGTMDSTFTPSNFKQILFTGKDVFLLRDGSILHRRIDSATQKGTFIKLETDGSINPKFVFDPNIEIISSLDALPLSDGKILLAGDYLIKNEGVRKSFIRINADGTYDDTYNWNNIFIGTTAFQLRSVLLQDDEKVLMAGPVSNFGNKINLSLIRFNTDGEIDEQFELVEGASSKEFAINIIPYDEERIVITGTFNEYNGMLTSRIARVYVKNPSTDLKLSVFPNPGNGLYNVKSNTSIQSITVHDYLGREINRYLPNDKKTILDLSSASAGVYFIKIGTDRGSKTVKVINQ